MNGSSDASWPQSGDPPDASHIAQEPAAERTEPESIAENPSADSALPEFPGSFFASYADATRPVRLPPRIPNMFDVSLLGLVLFFSWICSGAVFASALHLHLWGVKDAKQALNDIHYTLGTQVVWYFIAFAGCLAVFPALWHLHYFSALEWNARAAMRKRWQLITAAFACFVLAIADGILLPGPQDTPIDQVFRMPGAAWLLFGFGVTLAPFFEEMAFRGFLLPALNTAADWTAERLLHLPTPHPDMEGKPRWSVGAMIVGSVLTSIPFALMHAYQTGYSIGPFLLLVCVSLVLCWVRLNTRSLAASTMVHSSYNLLLFLLMIAGTGGFKHLDRM
ncbi:CPBP family intramembrane metalloprotease [Acidobacteria bacterium AB60]|nr:CPBP family intramembrane metalloprotease [Acidobacteria bacterium AB60]